MTEILLGLAAGLAAGMLAGLFGVGGGVFFVPVLTLGLGLSQIEGEATSLLAIIPTVLAGTWTQQRYGNVRWRTALVVGVVAIAGVEGGVRVAQSLPEDALRRLFGLLMLAVAAQITWRAWRSSPPGRKERSSDFPTGGR
jgi:uncharacterized membrane protein YfcA